MKETPSPAEQQYTFPQLRWHIDNRETRGEATTEEERLADAFIESFKRATELDVDVAGIILDRLR